ncbi:MAG: hypothetical protein WBF33_30845, partial [Candidatus Nitrosopolaris sp.]
MLRDKGFEEELALWEDEVFEFICCVCATVVDGGTPLNGIVIIIATANTIAIANANRFLIGDKLRIIHQIYSYACAASIAMSL